MEPENVEIQIEPAASKAGEEKENGRLYVRWSGRWQERAEYLLAWEMEKKIFY